MDYNVGKATNIILGVVSVGLAAYNYNDAFMTDKDFADEYFIAIVSLGVVEAVAFLLLSFCCRNSVWGCFDQIVRIVVSIILIAAGGWLIRSAIYIKDNGSSKGEGLCMRYKYFGSGYDLVDCQNFEIKIAAGVIAIINGFVYTFTKKKRLTDPGKVYNSSPIVVAEPYNQAQGAPYIVQQTNYMPMPMPQPQQQYQEDYRIPRFQAHQNYYNDNHHFQNSAQIPYPRQNNPLQQATSPYQYQYDYNPNDHQGSRPHQQYYH